MRVTDLIAAAGGLAFVVASLVVGGRLMWLARRTRGFPELVLGLALFLMGGVSYLLNTLAVQGTGLPHGLRIGLVVTQLVLNTFGMTGIALFTWRAFRPDDGRARAATAIVLLGYVAALVAQGLAPGFEAMLHPDQPGPWRVNQILATATPLWSGAEALRYHALLRRRLALGLAEPAVVDRFRLWGLAMWLASAITAIALVLWARGIPLIGTLAGALAIGPLGLTVAGLLWLAFFPPRAYLRFVERSAAAA
jgi:hypothetical protein